MSWCDLQFSPRNWSFVWPVCRAWSSCVLWIVGILRFFGSIVAGRRVAVGSVTDWIGFRVSFSDSVRGSVSMGD